MDASWQKVESALETARAATLNARKEEVAAGLLLDDFLIQGKEASSLSGNWLVIVADRRAAFNAEKSIF